VRFIINIRLKSKTKYTYTIDANTEEEALERLKLRLPPDEHESVIVDAIRIDPKSIINEGPYGVFDGM